MPETQERANRGEVALGGCYIGSETHLCRRCDRAFSRARRTARRIRYLSVHGSEKTVDDPYFVMREIDDVGDPVGIYETQRWVRGRWKTDMELTAYTVNGEGGATRITQQEADRLIAGAR